MEVASEHDGDRKNLLQSAINPELGTQLSLHRRLYTNPSLTLVMIDHNYMATTVQGVWALQGS